MAFTDRSDLFGSVHEDGLNLVVRHLMRQRPSLFNYATPEFAISPRMFCKPIEAHQRVLDAGNPLFTELEPLPVFGAPFDLGINFCLQVTEAAVDFHRGQVIALPEELGELGEQRFSLVARALGGIDCPSQEYIDQLLPEIEKHLLEQQELAVGEVEDDKHHAGFGGQAADRRSAAANAVAGGRDGKPLRGSVRVPPKSVSVFPTRRLECFELSLFIVGYCEWGTVGGSQQAWLKTRLAGLEVVDLQPVVLENQIECYLTTVLKLGVLPRLIVPLEKMMLDITATVKEQGLVLGKHVTLGPSAVPGDVSHNPAIEEDQLKAFAKLTIA
jgi:hypothetical protein